MSDLLVKNENGFTAAGLMFNTGPILKKSFVPIYHLDTQHEKIRSKSKILKYPFKGEIYALVFTLVSVFKCFRLYRRKVF